MPSPQVFPFRTGRPYGVVVRRAAGQPQVAVTDRTTSMVSTHTVADPRVSAFGGGYLGSRWRGQTAEVTDFSLAHLP